MSEYSTYSCEFCHLPFEGRVRDRNKGKARFCSVPCRVNSQRLLPRGIENAVKRYSQQSDRYIRAWRDKSGTRRSCYNAVWVWRKNNGWAPLPRDENNKAFQVHHKDHDRLNDEIENLVILSPKEHTELHRKESREKNHKWIGKMEFRKCSSCVKFKPLTEFHIRKKGEENTWQSSCKTCAVERTKANRKKHSKSSKKASLRKLKKLLNNRKSKR